TLRDATLADLWPRLPLMPSGLPEEARTARTAAPSPPVRAEVRAPRRPAGAPVRVVWEGAAFTVSSLAHVNRSLCRYLTRDPALDLQLVPVAPEAYAQELFGRHAALLDRY